jgi:hypothetical protein
MLEVAIFLSFLKLVRTNLIRLDMYLSTGSNSLHSYIRETVCTRSLIMEQVHRYRHIAGTIIKNQHKVVVHHTNSTNY